MLTIRKDPAGITGQNRYVWDYSRTIQDNIACYMADGSGCTLLVNGMEVDPLTCRDLDRMPTIADQVTVIQRPAGLDPITLAIIAVVAAVATYVLMPRPPGANVSKDSPNNSLTAQSNLARAYQAIPDVYGSRRVWPDLIQPSTVEYIDHVKFVTEWLCISRGQGTISEVKYADTPLSDITGASYEIFYPFGSGYPENGVTTIDDVVETFACPDVDGQEIEPPTPYPAITETGDFSGVATDTEFTVTVPDDAKWADLKAAAGTGTALVAFTRGVGDEFSATCDVVSYVVAAGDVTFTFDGPAWPATASGTASITIDLDGVVTHTSGPFTLPLASQKIRVNTVFLRGLRGTVVINAEWWQIDGEGVEISGTREDADHTFTADTLDQRFFTTDITPAAGNGRYRIQFTRTTADLGNGADVAKLESVFAMRTYATKTLPGVTVARVTTRATQEATGFRDRKFNLRFARYVRTLTSDTISASSNFARIMAHIWTVAGNDIAELDTAAMQAINTEHGETSALLRFDGSLDDADMSLGERLQLVANHARCLMWRDGTKWTVTRDQARDYPDIQLDYRNLSAGGESAISYAAHLPASFDGVEVEYTNETTQATKAYLRLTVASGTAVPGVASNPRKIKLMGCANTAQATNRAYLEANKLIYQRTSVTDEVLNDGGIIGPGSLVRWIDPNDFYGDDGLQAGEVLAIDGGTITTSEPLNWNGQTSGRIMFTGIDGARLGAPVVATPGGGAYSVTLASVPSGLYVAGDGAQLGSRYAFATGMTEAETEAAGLFTVVGMKPASNGQAYTLELTQYDSRIYSAD